MIKMVNFQPGWDSLNWCQDVKLKMSFFSEIPKYLRKENTWRFYLYWGLLICKSRANLIFQVLLDYIWFLWTLFNFRKVVHPTEDFGNPWKKKNIGIEDYPLVIFKNSGTFFSSRNWNFFVNSNRKLWSRAPEVGSPIYGLYGCVPRNRVWFLMFSVVELGIFIYPFFAVFMVWSLDRVAKLYYPILGRVFQSPIKVTQG